MYCYNIHNNNIDDEQNVHFIIYYIIDRWVLHNIKELIFILKLKLKINIR